MQPRPTQREERVFNEVGGSRLLSLHRTVIRVCAAPGAGGFVNPVAFERIRTAVGDDAGLLFGQVLRREYYQGFQGDLVSYVLTIADLTYIPLFLSHTAPPDYAVIV